MGAVAEGQTAKGGPSVSELRTARWLQRLAGAAMRPKRSKQRNFARNRPIFMRPLNLKVRTPSYSCSKMLLMSEVSIDDQILLLLQSSEGFERGFRLLMQSYQGRIYGHVRRMLADHEDANDVVQNTFIKAYRGLAGFEGRSSFHTWLYRIATNETLSFLDSQRRRSTDSIDAMQHWQVPMAGSNLPDADEINARLTQAIELLPDKQRAVFNLRYFDEMPYEQMSEVLDTSVGALKASYHHAAKKIEAYIKGIVIE